MESFYLSKTLFGFAMASSKNNENTVPIQGGSLGERIFYIITVITAVGEAMGEKGIITLIMYK